MGVGAKSDYRHLMSPITLAPAINNPWRNPMKSGIVSPAYDATDTVNYKYGPSMASNGAPTSSVGWGSVDDTYGNENGAHFLALNRWRVEPGAKSINAVRHQIGVSDSANASGMFIEVWRQDASEYTLVARSEDFGGVGPAGWGVTTLTPATPLAVTLEAGEVYYVGVRVVRTDNNAAAPVAARTATATPMTDTYIIAGHSVTGWTGTTLPLADVSGQYVITKTSSAVHIEVDYDSENYLEFEETTSTKGRYLIPAAVSIPYVVKLEDANVPDADTLTCTIQDNDTSSAFTTQETTTLDMGATDQVTCQTNNVAVTGAGADFDMVYGVFPVAGDFDLYYTNKEAATPSPISHACANAGSRGTRYSQAFGRIVTVSSTSGTLGKLQAGVHPAILLGDSNAYTTGGLQTNGLGNLPTSLTKKRVWIWHGKSGSDWSYCYNTQFANSSVGSGDGVEMIGLDALWVACGMGVNAGAGADANNSRSRVATQMQRFAQLMGTVIDGDDTVAIVGCPPYSGTASEQWANVVRWCNRAYLGFAMAWQVPYYNPWPDMVEPGTQGNAVPTFDATYSSDGIHYDAAGGAVVVPKLVSAIENATIDLRDAWD